MKFLKKIWHWVRWPLLVLIILFVAIFSYFIYLGRNKYITDLTVARIHGQHITMADVMGTSLPPQPYAPENDATVAGIDQNNNGIRDDVELAISKKYPNSAKIRAGELQYALDQQMLLTEVFNSETWIAQVQEDGRGYGCIADAVPNSYNLKEYGRISQAREKEVENLVFNTSLRKNAEQKVGKFATSFGEFEGQDCDIDLNTLPN